MSMVMVKSAKIVIVSEDLRLLDLLEKGFSGARHEINTLSPRSQELIESLQGMSPDLILLDIQMPSLDGIELSLRIRRAIQTPILMLSIWGAGRDMVRELDLGSESYLTRPFPLGELMERIGEILRREEPGS